MIPLYLFAIVLANLSAAHFGPSATVLNAFLFIGLDLSTRDTLHERWEGSHLKVRMALLIAAGAGLSWLLNRGAGQIALASLLAFAGAALTDTVTYTLLRRSPRLWRMNGSNVTAAAVDSVIFPLVAFGWPLL